MHLAENPSENVIVQTLGTRFDSLGEAYDFYNLYSREKGFWIRHGKSRLNVERTKCMQEIMCVLGEAVLQGGVCAKMTSTQMSESANQMLKHYVPLGCPMHMFVKKYTRLQFDRESDENYEEKRTTIGRLLMRANLAIERHASKICTQEQCLSSLGKYCMSVAHTRLKKWRSTNHILQYLRRWSAGRSGAEYHTRSQ